MYEQVKKLSIVKMIVSIQLAHFRYVTYFYIIQVFLKTCSTTDSTVEIPNYVEYAGQAFENFSAVLTSNMQIRQ